MTVRCGRTYRFNLCRQFLACVLCVALGSAAFADTEVSIADPGLEAAIRAELNQADGPLLDTALAGITRLIAENQGIISLTGIEQCTGLTELYLGRNAIADYSPLLSLPALTGLSVPGNGLNNIEFLRQLPQLTSVDISDNEIADIAPLADLTHLRYLWADNNDIVDLTPLSSSTDLEYAALNTNDICDISPLLALPEPLALTDLGLRNNPLGINACLSHVRLLESRGVDVADSGTCDVDDIPCGPTTEISFTNTVLEAAIRKNLNKYGEPLTDLDAARITWLEFGSELLTLQDIQHCVNLHVLKLQGIGPMDLSPLQSIASLIVLEILDTPIAGISGLDTLDQLVALTLSRTGISDLSPLGGLLNLGNLDLSENEISNLEPLESLTSLLLLDLTNNQIENISTLSVLTELYDLDISNNQIEDISPLASHPILNYLRAAHNNISDLSPLANLSELRELYLDDNAITSLSGLPVTPDPYGNYLQTVSASNNSIHDIAPLEHLPYLNLVQLDNNEVCDLTPLVANQEFASAAASCASYCDAPVYCDDGIYCVDRDKLYLFGNPLNEEACSTQVAAIRARNVLVKTGTACDFGGTTCGLPSTPERRATNLLDTFHQLDADEDGQLHPEEFEPAIAPEVFTSEDAAAWDSNGDGNLSIAELRQASRHHVAIHAADSNGNGIMELPELLRAIQLFNAGGIACADAFDTEDGYAPGDGSHDCFPHSSDFLEQDWSISLSELLRAIQLYNMGAYAPCDTSEDGYCLGEIN